MQIYSGVKYLINMLECREWSAIVESETPGPKI